MKLSVWIVALMFALTAVPAMAQQGPPGGGPGGGGPGGGGPPDFTEMRKRMEDEMKQDLDVTDDQWKTLQPKIEKIESLRQDVEGRRFGPPHGGPDNNDDEEVSAVQKAMNDLEDALDKDGVTDDQLNAKLEALHKAKEAAKEELAKARKELKEGLTVRQDAVLVARGVLS